MDYKENGYSFTFSCQLYRARSITERGGLSPKLSLEFKLSTWPQPAQKGSIKHGINHSNICDLNHASTMNPNLATGQALIRYGPRWTTLTGKIKGSGKKLRSKRDETRLFHWILLPEALAPSFIFKFPLPPYPVWFSTYQHRLSPSSSTDISLLQDVEKSSQ